MTITDIRPKPLDRATLIMTVVIGAVIVVTTAATAVIRVIRIIGNRDVTVTAAFGGVPATMPVGPRGSDVAVTVERALLTVSGLPPITVVALVLAEVVPAVAVVLATVCGSLVARNIVRGHAFGAANVGWAGGVVAALALGPVLTWLFATMGANGAAASVAGGPADTVPLSFEPTTILGIAALGAIAVVFQAGHRLQRDTDGLV